MPTLVLLAGPNENGKTTFINGFLRERGQAFHFVNPDAASLSRRERERDETQKTPGRFRPGVP